MVCISEGEVKLMVDSWNANSTVPMAVRVLLDDGSTQGTETMSSAWVGVSGQPFVKVKGISGAYSLFRVARYGY